MCPPGPRACARGRQKAGRCAGRTGRRAARPHAACDPEGSRRPRAICWHTPAPWCKTTSFIKKKKSHNTFVFQETQDPQGKPQCGRTGTACGICPLSLLSARVRGSLASWVSHTLFPMSLSLSCRQSMKMTI